MFYLTPREKEVLEQIAEGLKATEIAEKLIISYSTVKTHITHIFQRLGASNQAHAVAIGFREGILK